MLLGAIFRTVKGSYDAVTLRKKLKEYHQELSQDLLESFTPYEQFFAKERMLLAEYMIELSKLKARKARLEEVFELKEGMNLKMKQIVEKAERELEARNATKLDLARVVASLRELSLAVDRDLDGFRKDMSADQKKVQLEMKELDAKLFQLSERLEHQSREASVLQKKAQTISDGIEGLSKGLQKQDVFTKRRFSFIWLFNILILGTTLVLIWRR